MARQGPLGQFSKVKTQPAPVAGWNARDPLPDMQPQEAVILENFLPGVGGVSLRPGFSPYATGLVAPVETLMTYNGLGSPSLFGAAGTNVYNVTASGAVGAAAISSLGNARFQSTMFGTPAGEFLIICNGADAVRAFNGTTWSTPSITGASSASFVNVTAFAKRLWFIQASSLTAWYLDALAIAGAAAAFDLSSEATKGGHLVAMAAWTRDGGSGSDDFLAFITSAGQIILYQGTDPSTADTWAQVGTFQMPEPVGLRCCYKAGADVGIVTSQGVISLTEILPLPGSQATRAAATDKVRNAFADAYRAQGTASGWQIIEYPKGGIALVNVPQGGTRYDQFVLNAATGAWCRFTGLDAVSWSLLGDKLFFGRTNGTVCQYDTGATDDGDPITGLCLPAFQDFGTFGFKRFCQARPLFTAAVGTNPPLVVLVDYDTAVPSLVQGSIPEVGSTWDVAPWDTSAWGVSIGAVSEWQGLAGLGRVGSVILSVASFVPLTLQHIDVVFEPGGVF